MIYCEYNKVFEKIRDKDRIKSVPVLKNTCLNCNYKSFCPITKTNNHRNNNEYLVKNLLFLKDNIKENIREYYRIDNDIKNGLYKDSYKFDLIKLGEVEDKLNSVVYDSTSEGLLIEYSVEEFLNKQPHLVDKKKLVGYKKVTEVSDVVYGLDIRELEEDLDYVNEELRRLNKDNGVIVNV